MLLEAFFAMLLDEPCSEPLPDPCPFDVLSDDELMRLTHWKWKYALEAEGWTSDEACHLAFLRRLHLVGQL